MATISKLKGSNGTSYDIMDRVSRDESVYFIEPTGTAGSTTSGAQLSSKWTISNVGGLTTPYHGMKVAIKVPVAGVSTAGAIMSIDGGTTWHPIAYNVDTVFTTHYAVNTVKIFIYDADQIMTGYIDAGTSTSISGVWKGESNYDSGNTNTIGYQLRTNSSVWKAHSTLYQYELLCSVSETQLSPFNNVSNKSTTNTKALLTNLEFNPFGKFVYYGATTTVSAGSNISATTLWQQYNLTLGYSFNTAGLMTTNKDVFLRCVPQSNGMVKIDPATQSFTNNTGPISQLLPTTEDGFVYIYLGHATSDSNIELHYEHPVYFYKDNSLRIWTNAASADDENYYHSTGTWNGLTYTATNNGGTSCPDLAFTIPTGSTSTTVAAGNHSHSGYASSTHKHTITIASGSTGDVTVATGSSGTGDAAAQTHTHTASATGTTAVSAYTSNTPTYKKLTTTSQTNGTAASWSYTETLVTGTTDDYMLEFSWTANTPSSVATTVATGALESGAAGDLISSISFGGTNVAAQSHTHSVPATSTTKVTAVTGVSTTKLSATASTPTA